MPVEADHCIWQVAFVNLADTHYNRVHGKLSPVVRCRALAAQT